MNIYFNNEKLLKINNTIAVLIECWKIAEENLKDDIALYYPDVDEEFITQMFHGKYGAILSYASERKIIENAFLRDLQEAFPTLSTELRQIANGLLAEITIHKRPTEKITGGDIGILIIRPTVYDKGHCLKIRDYRRGLLCQAKLKNRKGKWNNFTKKQIQVLPEHLSYLSLLLYSYKDKTRHLFNSFSWQLCNSATLPEIQGWLGNDSFPDLVNSCDIVGKLGYGLIGTADDDIIDSVISPAKNPRIVISLSWPDGKRPGGPESSVRIYSRQENQVHQHVRIRL